jgi:hypothetical protein
MMQLTLNVQNHENAQRAHSPRLAAGLASELQQKTVPYIWKIPRGLPRGASIYHSVFIDMMALENPPSNICLCANNSEFIEPGHQRGVRCKSKIPDFERGRRIADPAAVCGRSAD